MILKVRHLEIVRAIHEEGTLTEASRRLFISQPALSRQLAKLEHRIGAALFRRHRKGMTLTGEGQRVLASASRIIEELARVEQDVHLLAGGGTGAVRIAVECFTCYHWLPQIVRRFRARHPRIELWPVPEVTRDPWRAVEGGGIDLAIVHSAPRASGEVHVIEIFRDEVVAVVAADHGLARESRLAADVLRNETLLCHRKEAAGGAPDALLRPCALRPRRVLELAVTPAVLEMARAGCGVAVLPRWILAQTRLDDVIILPIGEFGLWRSWYGVVAAARREDPVLASLIELLGDGLTERTPLDASQRSRPYMTPRGTPATVRLKPSTAPPAAG